MCSSRVEAQATWWKLPAPGRTVCREVAAAALLAAGFPGVAVTLELERFQQGGAGVGSPAVGADRVEALQGELGRNLGVLGGQRRIGDVDDEQLVVETLRVGEDEAGPVALGIDPPGTETLLPEGQRGLGGDAPDDAVDHPRPGPARGHAGVLEEGEVGARVAGLGRDEVGVEGTVALV